MKVALKLLFLFTIFSLLILYILGFRIFKISGDLMSPSFQDKEFVLVRIYSPQLTNLSRADVIVYKPPEYPEQDSLIRVVGFPGESVKIVGGNLYINNQQYNESSYNITPGSTDIDNYYQKDPGVTIPANHYYVLVDQRNRIVDSRKWGFLPKENIRYIVQFCF